MAAESRWPWRLLLLAINFIPALLLLLAGLAFQAAATAWGGVCAALLVLYLVPPLAARLVLAVSPPIPVRCAYGSRTFFAWWILFNLQVIFSRVPLLEELLRLIPSLYSNWLRLWGSKIGRLTYWGPGVFVPDRSFIRVGSDVIIGAAARISSHVFSKDSNGQFELIVAPVCLEDGCMIGAYSLLSPGAVVARGEATPALHILPPFNRFEDNKRIKGEGCGCNDH